MAKRRRSSEREAYWRDVLARSRTSGLSVRVFCHREKLHESAFYFWRRTLAKRDNAPPAKRLRATSKSSAPGRPAFLPVTIRRETPPPASGLTLELRSGNVLRFGDGTPVERIAALVRTLEAEARS